MNKHYSAYRWVMMSPGEPLEREEFFPSSPDDDEVLIEIAGCGVCHTDLGYYFDGVRTNHPLPLALGHEISGRVISAGKDVQEWLNKAVIVPSVIPCGHCDLCSGGHERICRNQKMPGNDIQGGFASHILVPANGLCAIDEERLAAIGLEIGDLSVVADAVTTPYQAIHNAGLKEGDLAIVIGVGGVGGYAVQIARAQGASVVAIDVDPTKLDTVQQHGASLALNAREMSSRDMKKAIRAFVSEKELPATGWSIFECSGSGAGQATAFDMLTHGATICVVGFTMEKVELMLSKLMAFDARAIGNWGCEPGLYAPALDLVLDGKINLASFIEQHPLDDINSIFHEVHSHALTRRAILRPAPVEA